MLEHYKTFHNIIERYKMFLDKMKKIEMEKKKKLERRQEEEKSKIEQLQRDRNIMKKGISIAKWRNEEVTLNLVRQ